MKLDKPNLRKIQAEERRLQILDTALKVFASKGFAGTSIKDISEAAGISQGLMYHYFAGKEALLEATVNNFSFLPQLRNILKDTGQRPISKVFFDIANGFLDVLDSRKMLVRIFIQEVQSSQIVRNAWANLCREGASLMQNYLESQIKNGELRPHNSEVTARFLIGAIFMYHFTQDVFQSSRVKREEFIKEVLTNTLKGIQST